MDRAGKVVISFSVLGIGMLYGVSLLLVPPTVPLDEIPRYEGSIIRTRGVVTDVSGTEYGHMLVRLAANQTALLLFVTPSDQLGIVRDLSYGDEVMAEGRVQVYRGEYELVTAEGAIAPVNASANRIVFISQLASDPNRFEGERIRVAGTVDDLYTSVLYLADGTGTYRLRVKSGSGALVISELQEGEKIVAEGVLSYDSTELRYELNLIAVEQLALVIEFTHRSTSTHLSFASQTRMECSETPNFESGKRCSSSDCKKSAMFSLVGYPSTSLRYV
jgi:hypothetical protein